MKVTIKNKEVLIDKSSIRLFEERPWHISDTGYVVWRGLVDGSKKFNLYYEELPTEGKNIKIPILPIRVLNDRS